MIESLLKNLNQDVALLQLRIERDKDTGFNDMARLLESMAIQFFKAVDIANLKSKNQIRVNFPAIDAADDGKDGGVAVQVTSVADAKKVNKTIETFEKRDAAGKCLKDGYAALYIFGFCKASTITTVPSYCKVIGPGFFLDKLVDLGDEEKVQTIIDSVRRHVDYSSIHPYDDIECLKIVLGYVGRNAVRHYMSCEGNIDDMTKGLREISELIGKGSVNGKQKSKAHHEFEDQEIGEFLRHVLSEIGGITAIVNRANRDGFVYLNQQDMMAIDERKQSIITSAMYIAASHGITTPLGMHEID
ncbi:SMEK domain-containing protein [Burkholderia pseudomallei]|nr:SMEK domain-containing protein [Burkholderia pseudomallei]